ncbi:MAG: hypothetical protein J1E04_01485 [Alistipes sp.]|nr:hypothetical protein [Alistipes sp.]
MDLRLSKLYLTIIALCGCLLLGACSRHVLPDDPFEPEAPGLPPQLDDSPVVMLHIGMLNAGSSNTSAGVQEMIRTLRIIMIHEDLSDPSVKYIEANRLIDAKTTNVSDFRYIFQKRTIVGKKSFYLIANEESVGKVRFKDNNDSPVGDNPELTTFLSYFDPDMPDDEDENGDGNVDDDDYGDDGNGGDDDGGDGGTSASRPTAVQFEAMLNSLYFEPTESYKMSGDKVFLPYSAYYTDFEIGLDDHRVDKTDVPMYLVPVATKFTFKFINERAKDKGGIKIDYLAIKKTNRTNYMMAQLEEKDLHKRFGTKDYYWIDWLNMVVGSLNTDNTEQNTSGNAMYGWIDSFKTPYGFDDAETCDARFYDFVREGWVESEDKLKPANDDHSWSLAKATEVGGKVEPADIPPFGPYYLPEGHHLVEVIDDSETEDPDASGEPENPDDTGDDKDAVKTKIVDQYKLKLRMRNAEASFDSTSKVEVKEAETEISNLKALFRNTNVLITITLREGGVNIFAEQQPWEYNPFYGYVKDEEDIK